MRFIVYQLFLKAIKKVLITYYGHFHLPDNIKEYFQQELGVPLVLAADYTLSQVQS